MSDTASTFDLDTSLARLAAAEEAKQITPSAAGNIRRWLTEKRYAEYAADIAEHIREEKWQQLDNVFWTVIPFGTGGRRGRMYPFGSNAINDRTIGESAQGLADHVKEVKPEGPWSAAIAYDTRHRSREFAELCAGILVANGFDVYFIDDYRSTPELSFLIRLKKCDCGIMVTASHNPPSDNAVKVYWSNGAQLVPPHDQAVIDKVEKVESIDQVPFSKAVENGKVHICTAEADAALLDCHRRESFAGPRDLKVIYSPLHGVGEFNVKSLMTATGFKDLEIYEPHREPNGDFPNVPGHVSNPENAAVFDAIIERARKTGAELILATDPDCDRMGAAAPVDGDPAGEWRTFNGNQLSVLLADYVLTMWEQEGRLTPEHYLVTTLVTTRMLRRMADARNVRCFDDNLVGFKWIASVMEREDPAKFLYGTEESHGFLVGEYCRDKDGAIACLLMSELAAWTKYEGRSVWQHLELLYGRYGYHAERLITIQMEGSDGMRRMKALMETIRTNPPATLGEYGVAAVNDYLNQETVKLDGSRLPLTGPRGDLVMLETEAEGNYVAVRPSGTEPKVKFYLFGYIPADGAKNLVAAENVARQRLAGFADDLKAFANSV